jgi:orotidine-5'-phosphate decarboxylase
VVDSRIIVALDVPTSVAAMALAESVRHHVAGFKIGLGLLHGPGPQLIQDLADLGRPVFADAKLHDIPSQVEAAARHLGEHGARWVTVHASGGPDMIAAAVTGLSESNPTAGVLAVTVLTSLEAGALAAVGIDASPQHLVARMAKAAAAGGCEGIVSSPHELATVAAAAPRLLRVIPGIRLVPSDDDQARTATPAEAIAAGADLLVVGRPITLAPDPAAVAAEFAELVGEV